MSVNNGVNNVLYGVTDGSVAAAGQVGEILHVSLPASTPLSVADLTNTNIITLVITPGDWDVWGSIFGNFSAGAQILGWISQISASQPDATLISSITNGSSALSTFGAPIVTQPMNVTVNTTLYLSTFGVFSTGDFSAAGTITARRVR